MKNESTYKLIIPAKFQVKIALTRVDEDSEGYFLTESEIQTILNFTNYLNSEKIKKSKFPSIFNLQSLINRVIEIILTHGDELLFRYRKVIAEFILSLQLWSIDSERDKITDIPILNDFLSNYQIEMGIKDNEESEEESEESKN